jgi:prolyl-tRNA synthetase
MYWSRLFIPTLRESPADVEGIALQLLMRAGYLRPLAGGAFGYLPAGQRPLAKIADIVRQEMDALGAQEIVVPALNPAAAAAIARGELRSYKQLPQVWYQIQPKSREEGRTKSGAPRGRQYLTGDSCSFDAGLEALEVSYRKHLEAYRRICDRCGLQYTVVEVYGGHAFVVRSETGEDTVVQCAGCGATASLEKSAGRAQPPTIADPEGDLTPEAFHTPDKKTIADVAVFTGLPDTSQMKSLVMVADGKPVLAMVRGDHQMNELKFAAAVGAADIRPAYADEIVKWFGAEAGSLGPVGVRNMRVVADLALAGRKNMIAGANRNDYHLRHVTPGEDFTPEFFDLRQAAPGDLCASCGQPLEMNKATVIGRLSKLSKPADVRVTNVAGGELAPAMGSYEIAIERILSAAVELYADKDGISLPQAIAPFHVVVTPVNMNVAEQRNAGETIYRACIDSGLDAVLDDRDERPGVKFKDSDLIGVPYRVTVGKKLPQGIVEVVERRTRRSADVRVEDVVTFLKDQ